MKKSAFIIILFAAMCVSAYAQNQQVRVFAHRGGRDEFDENTLSAFEASYRKGYRGYETDIRMTRDGQLVILHDTSLDRTTDMSGCVEEMTAEEIRKANTKKGNKVLFLDDLMDWIDSKGDITYVEFELKTRPVDKYPEARLYEFVEKLYARVMRNKPAGATYLFTSGDYRGLRYLQVNHPDAELLIITSAPCNAETINLCGALGIKRLGATMNGTSREAVQKAHEAGLTVSLWPGKTLDDFLYGVYVGADFLCTDIPVQVREFARKKCKWLDNVVY